LQSFCSSSSVSSCSSLRCNNMHTLLIIILILLLVGALPRWGYSSGWGYFPSGGLGLILLIIIILILAGHL
jgi:hypothetical protein